MVQLPVRVAAVNDYELIVAGVANLLSQFPDRLQVVERIVIGETIDERIDVALYDTYGRVGIAERALQALVEAPRIARIAVFSLDLQPALIEEGRAAGAHGFISKALSGDEIADAIVQVANSDELVVVDSPTAGQPVSGLEWPGEDDGLSERESQVLVLAAEGLSNREIAAALYLSHETVKSYLRQVFAKLDLHNRVQAANYVHRSGAFSRYQPAEPPVSPAERRP